jgi:metal-responsive CopG/Arc/MetJ family transcriptional regulator
MATVKTAISIESGVYRQVDRLAKKLHISRSQFFTQAARHMVERDENLELLQKINAAFAEDTEDGLRRKHEVEYARKKVIEEW